MRVESAQWPVPPDESLQSTWGGAPALCWLSPKLFVRTLSWLQLSDALPHLYPHGGLLRPDQTAKPLLAWLKMLRKETLV